MRQLSLVFPIVLSAACTKVAVVTEPPAAPTIQRFVATPSPVEDGAVSRLSFAVLGSTEARIIAEGGQELTRTLASSGEIATAPLHTSTVFTLIAAGPGGEARASVSVDVAPGLSLLSFSAAPNPVVLGSTVTLSYEQRGAEQLRILVDGAELFAQSGPPSSGSVNRRSRALVERYTLELISGARTLRRELVVEAAPLPRVLRFSADTLLGPADVVLDWDSVNASAVVLERDGMVVPEATAVSGQLMATIQDTTVFRLSAAGSVGPPDQRRLVVVVPRAEVEPNDDPGAPLNAGADGIDGQLSTRSDIDRYTIEVPAGASLSAETSGTGGCETDTMLTIYDPSGAAIAFDDDAADICAALYAGGPGSALTNLPAGRYTIEVVGYSGTRGHYFLRVLIDEARCGDGLHQSLAGEGCDDGARLALDGCSESCQLERPTELVGFGQRTWTTTVSDFGTSIAVSLLPSGPGSVQATLSGARCPAGTRLTLTDGGGRILGESSSDGCPTIEPVRDRYARLDGGAARLILTVPGPAPALGLTIDLAPARCGNGIEDYAERCDDGNLEPGDGCSLSCAYEPLTMVATPIERHVVLRPGERRRYQLITAGAARLFAGLSGPDCRTPIFDLLSEDGGQLLRARRSAPECLAFDPLEETPARLDAGTYYLQLDNPTEATLELVLRQELRAPGCGDGVPDVTEDCEDGNTTAGDGCDPSCHLEPSIAAFEEPDGDLASAHLVPLMLGHTTTVASSLARNDRDYFALDVPPGPDRVLDTWVANVLHSTGCDDRAYLGLRLLDERGGILAEGGRGRGCISIDPVEVSRAASLAPGRYYLEVIEDNNSDSLHRYYLLVGLR